MGSKTRWLWGCGIGCGSIVLIGIVLAVLGGLFVRDTMTGFTDAVAAREDLDQQFGPVEAFVPWPEGTVPAERLEAFLQVRQRSQPLRARIASALERLPTSEAQARELETKRGLARLREGLSIGKAALGLADRLGDFFDTRNRALIEAEMGMGEYTYLYVLGYHSWLGHSPGDGPDDDRIAVEGWDHPEPDDGSELTRRVRHELIAMLGNQLQALDQTSELREALAQEIDALEADRSRVPWQDGLPVALQASFEPYRQRLDELYAPLVNPFELARNRRSGKWSFTAD